VRSCALGISVCVHTCVFISRDWGCLESRAAAPACVVWVDRPHSLPFAPCMASRLAAQYWRAKPPGPG